MSKLLEIKSRIERLPQLQKQKSEGKKVDAFTERITEAHLGILACAQQRTQVLRVFPDLKLKKTEDAVKQSKAQAARLVEKLNEDFHEISNAATDGKITRIRERTGEAKDQIKKEWKRRLAEELKPLLPLVEIVREAELPGHQEATASLDRLQESAAIPPAMANDATAIRNDLQELREVIAELALEGPGGEFLKKAVKGRADAKDLLKEEVQEFLTEKDLWGILTIGIG